KQEQHVELKIVSPLTCNSRESDYVDIEVKTPSNLDTCGKESCFNNSASELALTSERDSKHMTRKNLSNQPNGSQMPEQSLFRSETQAQEGIATEESELFKQHFGSLSAASKIEGCKSSVRRSYSTMWCGVTILVFPRNSLTHPSEILVVKLQRLLK
ncbi:hypothetical protein LINPERPRIM_LOCUS15796, partial [Linum perenne]